MESQYLWKPIFITYLSSTRDSGYQLALVCKLFASIIRDDSLFKFLCETSCGYDTTTPSYYATWRELFSRGYACVMLAGFGEQKKKEIEQKLEDLKVKIHTLSKFDESVTHVITPSFRKPTTTSLSASLTGKWIVYPSWVNECVAQKRLVPEGKFGLKPTVNIFRGKRVYIEIFPYLETKPYSVPVVQNLVMLAGGLEVQNHNCADYIIADFKNAPSNYLNWQKFIVLINNEVWSCVTKWKEKHALELHSSSNSISNSNDNTINENININNNNSTNDATTDTSTTSDTPTKRVRHEV